MGARILLAEDEAIVALDIERRLEALGHEVVARAATAADAVSAALSMRPDLVLMDVRLRGGRTGIDAAAEIRAVHAVPVVYLTAYGDAESAARMSTHGAGVVRKPADDRALANAIGAALARGTAGGAA